MRNSLTPMLSLSLSLYATNLFAGPLKPMPEESGVSGSIVAGVASAKYSSNMIAGPGGDLGNKTIEGLDQTPGAETNTSPLFTGELTYTFAPSKTQIYFGSELEDLVRYDLTFQLGVRKQLESKTTLYGAFLFSGVPTKIYADPYVINSPRNETDRDSSGFRLGAQNLFKTGLGLELSIREIDVNDELSGAQLLSDGAITSDEQASLQRDGEHVDITANFVLPLSKGHLIVPELSFESFDLDGEARSRDAMRVKLSYFYTSMRWSLITTAYYSVADYNARNPIFNVTEEVDTLGASAVLTYNQLFGAEDLSLFTSVAAGSSDSNIDFYDQEAITGSLGVIYQF